MGRPDLASRDIAGNSGGTSRSHQRQGDGGRLTRGIHRLMRGRFFLLPPILILFPFFILLFFEEA